MRRAPTFARVPLPAAGGLLTGIALGLTAFVIVQSADKRPSAAPFNAPDSAPAQAAPELAASPSAPAQLVGLKGAAVRRAFGEPEMRRREPPAEVWQYRSARCVLDLYFYGDPDGEGVVHYDSRPRGQRQAAASGTAEACIGELAGRKRPVV